MQSKAPGRQSPPKYPYEKREPVPPRIARNPHAKSESELNKIYKERAPIQAKTFKEANAK